MRSRLRLVLAAFVTALVAFAFAFPFLKGDACADAGGQFDRATLTCTVTPPASPASPPR
ncbi:hypothetical protein [Sphingomonas sp. CFBP 13720]|uniref:hypothetical protein n=1 Tax=Sphingomonas sp. CFBP 13720 TaxID=2775302 RepID=UPI001785C9AC|nr:hypothetical protein [Sphingomonas sp. CFBP 13720]MBD8679832.1 hypothetical protein [Sphingomonas sp. CFBP 13720]